MAEGVTIEGSIKSYYPNNEVFSDKERDLINLKEQTHAIIKLIEDKISKGYDDQPNQLKELIKVLKGEA